MHRIAWHALARSSHAGRSQRRAGLVAPRVSILVIGTIEFARAPTRRFGGIVPRHVASSKRGSMAKDSAPSASELGPIDDDGTRYSSSPRRAHLTQLTPRLAHR